MMKNAKVTRVEKVNGGSMLTITVALPDKTQVEDFCEAVKGYLNGVTEGQTGVLNSWDVDQDIRPGDELTTDGEIVECANPGQTENTYIETAPLASHQDWLTNKAKY